MAVLTVSFFRVSLFSLLLFGESYCSLAGGAFYKTTPHEYFAKRNTSLSAGTVSTSSSRMFRYQILIRRVLPLLKLSNSAISGSSIENSLRSL